jgi:F-type H+-transporting ATPase subunit a
MEIHPSLWTSLLADLLHVDAHTLAIWDHVIAAGIVFIILLVIGLVIKSGLKLIPSGFQQLFELVMIGLLSQLDENLGEKGRKYLPLIGALAFFIFISNLLGLVPTFSSSTANFNTTAACAVIVFFYYNYQGFKEHGAAYIKHFMGPMPALAPLMFPIEIISHLARPFSLAVRLFGNISGEHTVSVVLYGMLPFLLPLPMMAFGLFASFLQTFVFILLSQIYIAGAIAHDH